MNLLLIGNAASMVGCLIMVGIGCLLIYLALAKDYVPIATPVPTTGASTPNMNVTYEPVTKDNVTVIRKGTTGTAVQRLQQRLTQLGYYNSAMDGVCKADDVAAIPAFQRMNGLTVDGRVGSATAAAIMLAGEPISKNLCASVGMDKKGITGLIHSASKFDFTQVPNGAVLDLHLHPSAVKGEEGIEVMTALLKTYLSHGGFAAHFNIVDPETLRKAQKEPEKYQGLQIRVCGWNVLWNNICKKEQDAFIRQAEGLV